MKLLRHAVPEVETKYETKDIFCPGKPITHAFLTSRLHVTAVRSSDQRKHPTHPGHELQGKILSKETGIHQIRDVRQDPHQQNAKADIDTKRSGDHNKRQWITHTLQVRRNTAKSRGIDGQLDDKKLRVW